MNKSKHRSENEAPRQLTFNFTGDKYWEQLPKADQIACRKALSLLIKQIVDQSNNYIENDERKDSN